MHPSDAGLDRSGASCRCGTQQAVESKPAADHLHEEDEDLVVLAQDLIVHHNGQRP